MEHMGMNSMFAKNHEYFSSIVKKPSKTTVRRPSNTNMKPLSDVYNLYTVFKII